VKRIAPILLCCLLFSGCFIAEELDKGEAILDQHGAGLRRARAAAKAKAAEEAAPPFRRAAPAAPGIKQKLSKWWKEVSEEGPAPDDPNNGVVRCELGKKVLFTRQKDCEIRGGRAVSLPKRPKIDAHAARSAG
jgi:hypothetical protein